MLALLLWLFLSAPALAALDEPTLNTMGCAELQREAATLYKSQTTQLSPTTSVTIEEIDRMYQIKVRDRIVARCGPTIQGPVVREPVAPKVNPGGVGPQAPTYQPGDPVRVMPDLKQSR